MSYKDVLYRTSTMPYEPSSVVLKGLYRLRGKDRALRLRWSDQEQQWCVEIKCARAQYSAEVSDRGRYQDLRDKNGWRTVERDSWICQRDGYVIVGYWPARPILSDRHIAALSAASMENRKPDEIADELDSDYEAQFAAKKQAHSNDRYDYWTDWYQWRQHVVGEKAYVPHKATGLDK